jgi:hypothetical protein
MDSAILLKLWLRASEGFVDLDRFEQFITYAKDSPDCFLFFVSQVKTNAMSELH